MATPDTAGLKVIELRSDWDEPGSAAGEFESTIVEVEYLLLEAPNVKESYLIFDSFGDRPLGFAIEFLHGERTFTLAGQGGIMGFNDSGDLVLLSISPEKVS